MSYEIAIDSAPSTGSGGRALVTSYDSGYEHSLDHWAAVRRLVEEADKDFTLVIERSPVAANASLEPSFSQK